MSLQSRAQAIERERELRGDHPDGAMMEHPVGAIKTTPGQCPTPRHIRREHSSLNLRTGAVSAVEKVTWSTEACASPLFGKDRVAGVCSSCAKDWTHPGSRLASECTLEQAQADYESAAAAARA